MPETRPRLAKLSPTDATDLAKPAAISRPQGTKAVEPAAISAAC